MRKLLWEPSKERVGNANITRFIDLANKRHNVNLSSYAELYSYSINNLADFWSLVWEFTKIKASKSYDAVVVDSYKMPGAKWFIGSYLNFAENLLRYKDNHIALIFKGENQKSSKMSYAELYDAVARLTKSLREIGVRPGDRVAAYMPNVIETVVGMLASTSIGAIWSSSAVDMGPSAILERFGQIEPKVLFIADGYFYKGKALDRLSYAAEITKSIPSIKKVIVASYIKEKADISRIQNAVHYKDFVGKGSGLEIFFEQLPFDHPVYIMFSSGTTGKPKCIVQGAGGVLINQLKEQWLHTDLKRGDVHFYVTTPSWMMWNWLVSSLGVGASIVLYDGNVFYPDAYALWQLIQDEGVTIFGTSASYIEMLRKKDMQPKKMHNLSLLRTILQTGSPLSEAGFEYVYQAVKGDVHFSSISGGTDINGCFAAGNPISPVYAGQLQGPALGIKIKAYDENGNAVMDKKGELICEAACPSMPLCFWNDPDAKKYKEAYFCVYPNVWWHGDFIIMHSDTGGITFCGRSDAILKPSGVRIGTAEIYRQLECVEEIQDSLAVGQDWKGDQRIILFVRLVDEYNLTEALKDKIRKMLREKASPHHVPAKIIQVPDIPYTLNMKKVETAVTHIINGRIVTNKGALINPESLEFYINMPELKV